MTKALFKSSWKKLQLYNRCCGKSPNHPDRFRYIGTIGTCITDSNVKLRKNIQCNTIKAKLMSMETIPNRHGKFIRNLWAK